MDLINKVLIIIWLMAGSVQYVATQTCCSAGAPISSSIDIVSLQNKSIAFQIDYEYNSVNLLIDNNERLINDPRKRNGQNILFRTDFSLNKHWAFSAFLPYVSQNRKTFSESENAKGIGDLTILAQYSTYQFIDNEFKFSAGLKFPTGNQYLKDNRNINLSPDMQSGSGTFDFMGRFAFVSHHIFRPNLSFLSALSYRHNNTNAHFGDPERRVGRQFKFGNEVLFTTAFSYLITTKAGFLRPELGLQLRYTNPNEEEKMDAANSGGFWLNAPWALVFARNDNFSIRLFGEIPIKQYLKGLQITTNYRLGIQFRYQFVFSNGDELL